MPTGEVQRILGEQRTDAIHAILAARDTDTASSGKDAVARTFGVAPSTVARWIDRDRPVLTGLRRYNREYHQDLLADRVTGLIERINPDDPSADPNDIKCLAIATGILSDKLMLLQGSPTSIIGHLEPVRNRVFQAAEVLGAMIRAAGIQEHSTLMASIDAESGLSV